MSVLVQEGDTILKIRTPKFRVSFPAVFSAKSFQGGKATFSLVMLFNKKLLAEGKLNDLINLIKATAMEEWGEIPEGVLDRKEDTCPIHDGDLKNYDGYENTYYARAASQFQPNVIDTGNPEKGINPQSIVEESEFYSGCYARASITAWTWGEKMGKRGISFGLQNVQKIADGEPFSGRGDPLEDFDPIVPEKVEVADTNDLFEVEAKKTFVDML